MKLGRFDIFPLLDGYFYLDGGAMFGVVPRALWEKTNPPDERNRIRLALGALLVRAHEKNILIDTGIGNKGDDKFTEIYAVERRPTLEESMAPFGVTPREVHLVINTHFHFDHAGGNTTRLQDGRTAPSFPNGEYYIQRDEWQSAISPNERTQRSYRPEDYEPLLKCGQLNLLDGAAEILPGIRVIKTPGHTEHHQSVIVQSEGKTICFLGDLIPTRSHLPLPYIMAIDLFPLTTLETKRRLLDQAYEERWLLFFPHDPETRMGRLLRIDGKYRLDDVRSEE
ncbi:MAG: MBL fold metallo-hydrolase [Deltaproteobacteria bacterium]|nr:MBL fold metallo-hydrolase [Deltaproteobacteria bacterium]